MGKIIDLTNMRFGTLIVVKKAERKVKSGSMWVCKCDCGNVVLVRASQLKRLDNKGTKSCGCLKSSANNHSKERLYRIWFDMKRRCYDNKNVNFSNYGKRGITICNEWKSDYLVFKQWSMKNGYSKNLSIDRINVNGNYCPENCRWANAELQARNTRTNHYVFYNDIKYTITEFSRMLNISTKTVSNRLAEGMDTGSIAERYLTKNGQI